ncbi:predicted protein [Histoplasma capsulatum H143]|uniref:Uncharacterized protein n=1 Tax=Ajellomyces capsulatus (strain H143) TaxID=544712 RepID=C6HS75_AJECH|nr:predicted protein [Histoplasma capsulatum H143]
MPPGGSFRKRRYYARLYTYYSWELGIMWKQTKSCNKAISIRACCMPCERSKIPEKETRYKYNEKLQAIALAGISYLYKYSAIKADQSKKDRQCLTLPWR